MSDQKLLELAAKAGGYELSWGSFVGERIPLVEGFFWDPRENGDVALRLAVRLGLSVNCYTSADCVADGSAAVEIYTPELPECIREEATSDAESAVRLAIFRAAVEIGKLL